MISRIFVVSDSRELPFNLPDNGLDNIILQTPLLKIGIEEVRDLKKKINLRPIGPNKTIIILESEKLTLEAQNALLKTLEEPLDSTSINLVTKSLDNLLPTILSRCQIITRPQARPQTDETVLPVLKLIDTGAYSQGFAWAAKLTDRQTALAKIDKLLIAGSIDINPKIVKKLLQAKKYLLANTNVRLTLENLFLT